MSSSYKIQAVLLVAVGAVMISFSRFVTLTSTFTGHFGVDSEEIDRRMRLEAKIRHTKYNISLPKLTVTDPASEMNEIPAPKFHLVISTGCSPFQDWQTFALFYHARKQIEATEDLGLSYATRVVSGCSEEDETRMNQIHEETIAPMAPGRFFIHHTPSYRYVKPGVDYVFFNKAFGYHHWMINSLRYPYNHQQYDDVTYILLDPDMVSFFLLSF